MKIEDVIKRHLPYPFGVCDFEYLRDRLLPCRAAERLPKLPRAVICFTVPYNVREQSPENISRYAAVPDYHSVLEEVFSPLLSALKAAFPKNEFAFFTDNSPIPEVRAAAAAGLGTVGKHGLLITEKYGSFVFLAEIVTDLPLKAEIKTAFCEDCGLCAAACPVGLNKEACLSALTQKKQPLTQSEEEKILALGSVWGCDICQSVCPKNKGAALSDLPLFVSGYRDRYTIGEDIKGRAYAWRGEKVIRRNAELIKCRECHHD